MRAPRGHLPRKRIKREKPIVKFPGELIPTLKHSRLLDDEAGHIIMRAMIFYNDLSTLNYFNYHCDKTRMVTHDVAQYMRHWELRMMTMTLWEAIEVAAAINGCKRLQPIMKTPELQEYIVRIRSYLPGGSQRDRVEKLIRPARNWMGAHVDPDKVKEAMRFRAKTAKRNHGISWINARPWGTRFKIAEDVLTTILVRFVWEETAEGDEIEQIAEENGKWLVQCGTDLEVYFRATIILYIRTLYDK